MKKSTILILGFFGLAIIDTLIGYIFPIDFTYMEFSVVPHFCLIGTLIYVCDKEWLNRILIGALVGLVYDMLFTNAFPIDLFLFAIASYGIGYALAKIKSKRLQALVVVAFVFVYDLIPYIWNCLFDFDSASFSLWFLHMELITIGLSAVTFAFLTYVEEVMSRFFLIRMYRDSKNKKRTR